MHPFETRSKDTLFSQPMRALFIARWGALLEQEEPKRTYEFKNQTFRDGILEALFLAGQAGWTLYLVGNEEPVAFGKATVSAWRAFENELLDHLKASGVPIKRNYACLDHPEGKNKHARDSVYLLPNTGAFYHARQFDGVYLDNSWLLGSEVSELVGGWRAGVKVAALAEAQHLEESGLEVDPDLTGLESAALVRTITGIRRAG